MLEVKELEINDISNSEYIENLFKKLSRMRKIDIMVSMEDGNTVNTTLVFIGNAIFITDSLFKNQRVKITFIYNDYAFYFFTHVGSMLKINMPKTIYQLTKRELERYIIQEDENAYVILKKNKYRILNIHTKGLSFQTPKKELAVGDILHNFTICLDDEAIFVDAEIRHVQKSENMYIYGLAYKDIYWLDKMQIIKYVLKNSHTNLKKMSDYSQDEIYELFERSGYLDNSNSGFESNFTEMINTLRKIDDLPHISKSFVYVDKNNNILSGANIIKLYNYTFLAQHLAIKKDAKSNLISKMDIYKTIQNYILNHDYFKYYLSYFDRTLDWHKGLFQRISEHINNPEKFLFEELTWFISRTCENSFSTTNNPYTVEYLNDPDEFVSYADKNIRRIESGCYCYNEDIHLDKIKSIYSANDLYAERKIFRVSANGDISAYVVAEAYTSGLNLFNCIDSAKVYFIHSNIDPKSFLETVHNELNSFYREHNKNHFHILFNAECGINFDNINLENFKRIIASRVIANNDGIREYKKYFKTMM
ncbi:MAG TPA: PilZ domain-containing protein [Pseudobacteroides sp.]|nr:PilZ domain-containing protein [Pseudobacteroides sp.]